MHELYEQLTYVTNHVFNDTCIQYAVSSTYNTIVLAEEEIVIYMH